MFGLQDLVNTIRALPVAVPSSSMIVESNFRKRLVQTVDASIPAIEKLKAKLLAADVFGSKLNSDATELTSEQTELLVASIATHSCPIYYVKPDVALEPVLPDSVIEKELSRVVATPQPVRAKEHHVDSLEVTARLLRAEALLEELESLIAPLVNNEEEREPIDNAFSKFRTILKSFWPMRYEEVAENPRSERRAEWLACLHDIVSWHWKSAATKNGTKPPSKVRIAVVTADIAEVLGVSEPPTPGSLKRL